MLSVSSLQNPNHHLSPQMMMRNGKLFHMRWFARSLTIIFNSTKLPYNVKLEVQNNIADVDMANKSIGLNSRNIIDVQLHKVKLQYDIS